MHEHGHKILIKIGRKEFHSALEITMEYIGGKWKAVILWHISQQTCRFSGLKKLIPDISEKMLAQQLREMEKQGFISRKIYPVIPPQVEYDLTDSGKTLVPLLEAMDAWGKHKGRKEGETIMRSGTY